MRLFVYLHIIICHWCLYVKIPSECPPYCSISDILAIFIHQINCLIPGGIIKIKMLIPMFAPCRIWIFCGWAWDYEKETSSLYHKPLFPLFLHPLIEQFKNRTFNKSVVLVLFISYITIASTHELMNYLIWHTSACAFQVSFSYAW